MPRPITMIRLGLMSMMGWWCLILAWPIPTFPTSASYRLFESIGTEHQWSVFCGAVCLISLASFRWLSLRRVAAQLLSLTHGMFAVLFFLASPGTTGTGTYAIWAILAAYLVIADRHG